MKMAVLRRQFGLEGNLEVIGMQTLVIELELDYYMPENYLLTLLITIPKNIFFKEKIVDNKIFNNIFDHTIALNHQIFNKFVEKC